MWPFQKKKKSELFSIEYYPLSGKYFPKYKKNYLKESYWTGVINSSDFLFADNFTTEEKARKFIKKAEEQWFKNTVKVIKISSNGKRESS